MKTQTKWLLNLVNGLLNFTWYVNFILCGIGIVVLTIVFITSDYTAIDTNVKYKAAPPSTSLSTLSAETQSAGVLYNESVLHMRVKVTAGVIISAFFIIAMYEVLVILILYNLRKIFLSIKQQQPFQYDNIRRLKITAICFALFTAANIVVGLIQYFTLTGHITGFSDKFMMVWSDNLRGVVIGAILYIMADVFSYGFELKKENEEFV